VTEKCAPSLVANFFDVTPGVREAVRRGWVFVAPDYPGLGSAKPHPYLGGVPTARSILDGVRAARAIPGAAAGEKFAVWGESQGGHAALWTAQLARRYAPDLYLVGAAAAAPPTDLVQNLTAGSDPSIKAFLTAFTAYSWSQAYGAPLATLGNRSTRGVITRLAQNNCISLDAKPKLGTMLGVLVLRRDLKNVDLGRIEPWATIARRNSVAARGFDAPLLIAQNPQDALVSPAVTLRFARQLCRNGVRVRYLPIAGKGHETSARDSTRATLDWIDVLFNGVRAPGNCGNF
jgi:acetyl esterase/lipase